MGDTVQVKKEALTLERIALAAMVALLSWNVYTTSILVTDLAVMSTKVESLELAVNIGTQDRYTRSQANSDRALLENKVERLEQWVGNLSTRLADVESDDRRRESER